MKILHTIHSANPVGGGPIEAIRQLSLVMADLGHRIEIVCLDAPDSPWLADFPLPIHALGPGLRGYGYSPRFVPWLRQHAAEFDVVIVNGLWLFNTFGAWLALRHSAVPYVVFTHGMLDPWFRHHYPLKHLKKWLYWPWADYRVLRDARTVLFTAEEERLASRRSFWLYRCHETVVNLGTAAPTGDPAGQRERFFEKFPLLREPRLLLFLGRIHEKKGCAELIEAFHRARGAADLHLVMAGPADGAYGRQVQALSARLGLEARVTWTGMLSGDLKWGAFHAAEAFILPSHQENFGISVAEALACGVPVLISDRVNIWREIDEDRAGLIEPDTADGTVRLIERWLALDPADRARMAAAAAPCFRQRFEIGQAVRSLLEALTHLVHAPGRDDSRRRD
ncbi:MAG: glycosyltransferase [Chthoniobacteraceae bacterium]